MECSSGLKVLSVKIKSEKKYLFNWCRTSSKYKTNVGIHTYIADQSDYISYKTVHEITKIKLKAGK